MSRHADRARAGENRASLYDEITDKIIAELEAGCVPWVQPWGTAAARAPLSMPKNASTGRQYSGVNVLILWGAVIEHGFAGQSWLTFRQALSLGGHVRKGEQMEVNPDGTMRWKEGFFQPGTGTPKPQPISLSLNVGDAIHDPGNQVGDVWPEGTRCSFVSADRGGQFLHLLGCWMCSQVGPSRKNKGRDLRKIRRLGLDREPSKAGTRCRGQWTDLWPQLSGAGISLRPTLNALRWLSRSSQTTGTLFAATAAGEMTSISRGTCQRSVKRIRGGVLVERAPFSTKPL
jgi:hypothetical protein